MSIRRRVRLSQVEPDPDQPRKHFALGPLQELAGSIKVNGLLQPITVRLLWPDPRCVFGDDRFGEGARFMIVAGERRWRAHQLAPLDWIEVDIVDIDVEKKDVLAIVENLQRENITPLEEARAFQRAMDQHGLTVDGLAKRLGMKQPWRITERTALLRMRAEYQFLLEKGQITPSQATELARHAHPQQDALIRLIRDGKCASYAKLRAASDGLLQAAAQSSFVEELVVSESDQARLTAFERKIDQVVQLVARGFEDGEVAILRKINPARAGVVAEQLAIIEKNLKQLGTELQKAIARGAAQESA
jgi:ParB family chromosome partitioning protein